MWSGMVCKHKMINPDVKLSTNTFKKILPQASTRDGYGEGLVLAGETDKRVVVLTADLGESTRTNRFKEIFPDRFFDVGVAEQALATVASGLASYGKIPFISSYAIFSPGRNWEQIRTTIALNNVAVIFAGHHAGLSVGPDGATHQALEDIALMRALPNMTVVVPADFEEAKKATVAAAKLGKPIYLRFVRATTPSFTTPETPFKIGKANILWENKDPKVAIIACGPLVYESLKAAKILLRSKIGSLVINNHTIKPMDEQAIIHAAKIAGAVVTVEEHQVSGGMGSAIAEVLSQNFPVPMEMVGVKDAFGESGTPKELLKKFGLTATDIAFAAKRVIRRRVA